MIDDSVDIKIHENYVYFTLSASIFVVQHSFFKNLKEKGKIFIMAPHNTCKRR